MSRLIGHVQMNDVVIGHDTGYRVCAYLKGDGIVGYTGDDMPLIKKWLDLAAKEEGLNRVFKQLSVENPFEIRLSFEGYGEDYGGVDKTLEIKF